MRLVTNVRSNTCQALEVAAQRLGSELRSLFDFETEADLVAFAPEGAIVFLYGWPKAAEKTVEFLRGLGVPIAAWQVDDPHFLRSTDLREVTLRIARRSTLYFSHTSELDREYKSEGVSVHYLPTGARVLPGTESLVAPPLEDTQNELDYTFVGTPSERREEFLRELARRLGNRFRSGVVSGVPLREAYKIYRTSRINLFIGGQAETGEETLAAWGLTERSWEVPLVGGFLLQEDRRHLRDHFAPGDDAVTFTSLEECAEKIEHYLANPTERIAIARRAHERILGEHLMEHRLSHLVRCLKRAATPAGASSPAAELPFLRATEGSGSGWAGLG